MDPEELEAAHSLHRRPLDAQRCMHSAPPPEVNNQLLGFADVEGEVVGSAPFSEELHFFPVCSLIIVGDVADDCSVVSKLDDGVGAVLGRAVIGLECEEQG